MLFPLLGIVLRQAVHQVCQHLIVLVVGIGRISADPFPIELMLICSRILRKDLLRDKLIAQRTGKDGVQFLREHVVPEARIHYAEILSLRPGLE